MRNDTLAVTVKKKSKFDGQQVRITDVERDREDGGAEVELTLPEAKPAATEKIDLIDPGEIAMAEKFHASGEAVRLKCRLSE